MQHSKGSKPSTSQNQSRQNPNPPENSTRTRTDVLISQNRIRGIMKSSPEVDQVGNETLFVVTKAVELFIDHMARKMVENPRGLKSYDYQHLAQAIQREDNLGFLKEITPLKIPARVALQEVAKQKKAMAAQL